MLVRGASGEVSRTFHFTCFLFKLAVALLSLAAFLLSLAKPRASDDWTTLFFACATSIPQEEASALNCLSFFFKSRIEKIHTRAKKL
ncbi:hypothetical protein MRX96_054246 [Rhipicephalus microplus]